MKQMLCDFPKFEVLYGYYGLHMLPQFILARKDLQSDEQCGEKSDRVIWLNKTTFKIPPHRDLLSYGIYFVKSDAVYTYDPHFI